MMKRIPDSLLAIGLAATAGCAGHASTMHDVRHALAENELEEARALLADAGKGTGDLLFALEDGLLLHYLGDYGTSNSRFEFAEQRVDDLYTRSITRSALSLLTSDLILRFRPQGIENFIINYYRGLNYAYLGEPEEALVEWRKLAAKLKFSRQTSDESYHDPPFFHYLVGLGLETDDPANAYVSYRLAEAGYRREGRAPPSGLVDDCVRLAARLGYGDDLMEYERRYGARLAGRSGGPGLSGVPGSGGSGSGPRGELVVFVEEGFVAPVEEVAAYVPILESREKRALAEDEDVRARLAVQLAREYRRGEYRHVHAGFEAADIAYVLPLALPVVGEGEPAFQRLEITVDGSSELRGEPVLGVSELQMHALEDRLLGIYAKTIMRALIKYAAAQKLEEEARDEMGDVGGDIMKILTNAANVLTERADTRAWLGLPHRFWMARTWLPAGRHHIFMSFDGIGPIDLGEVEIRKGRRTFLSHRVF